MTIRVRNVGLDVEKGCSVDHVYIHDTEDIVFNFQESGDGHTNGVWSSGTAGREDTMRPVIARGFRKEMILAAEMEVKEQNDMGEAFYIPKSVHEFREYLDSTLDPDSILERTECIIWCFEWCVDDADGSIDDLFHDSGKVDISFNPFIFKEDYSLSRSHNSSNTYSTDNCGNGNIKKIIITVIRAIIRSVRIGIIVSGRGGAEAG